MTKILRSIALVALLSVLTTALCIGYATISSTLNIVGSAALTHEQYKGVYIQELEMIDASNATVEDFSYVLPTTHLAEVTPHRTGASVTYRVRVFNNTDLTYWYIDQHLTDAYGQNGLVGASDGITVTTKDHQSDTDTTFNDGDWIPPQTERDFYVTYTFGANAKTACNTMIQFHFDIKVDAVHDEFLAILNDTHGTDSYTYLADVFNKEYAKDQSVSISSATHPEVFKKLFGDLTVIMNGGEKTASVVIRRENIDKDATSGDSYSGGGPSGCEYTLYITVESPVAGQSPTVYAIAYSEGNSGIGDNWYQVGELYEGTAPILADGSIDYTNWVAATKTYKAADGITYDVAQKNGDQYDLIKTIEGLISTDDQDIFNTIDNSKIFKKVYDIIQEHQSTADPALYLLIEAFYNAAPFYNNLNNGQEFKVVRNTYTRAEIIPVLKSIQSALDYFYEAFPE